MSTVPATPSPNPSARQVIRQLSPLITITTTWMVRKAMVNAYQRRTGQPAPLIYASGVSPVRKVIWSAIMAGTVALIEIVILELAGED